MSYSPLLGNPVPQFEDSTGAPYTGMRLFVYLAGTTTKSNSFTDSTTATSNTNPLVIDASGYPTGGVGFFGDNSIAYKVVAAAPGSDDPPAVALWTVDNISASLLSDWGNGTAATYISSTTFSVVGDQTSAFHVGRRLKLTTGADRYTSVLSSVYGSVTTVTVGIVRDSSGGATTLHASNDTVYLGILAGNTNSALNNYIINVEIFGAVADGATDNASALLTAANALPSSGGELHFTENIHGSTYVISNLVLPDKPIKFNLSHGVTLKHVDSATDHMIEAVNSFTLTGGGTLDGNKANQTGRYDIVHFIGDNLKVNNLIFTGSVADSIYVGGADTVEINNNNFLDLGEHGSVHNENSFGIQVDTSAKVARVHIKNNFFKNSAPSAIDLAPSAMILSLADTFCKDSQITGNTISGFGQQFSTNPVGCIEIYNTCDNLVISGNTISDYYFSGIRVNDSGRAVITHNTIVDAAADIGSGYSAFSYQCKNHGSIAKSDTIISNNIIDNEFRGGMYVSGGGASYLLHRAITHDNHIMRAGAWGIYHAYTDGEIVTHHNIIENVGDYGIKIDNCSGSMLIDSNVVDNSIYGIYARTSITSLDLKITNNTIDTATSLGITCRTMNSCVVLDNEYRGTAPATADFDYTVTAGRVEGNSWQATKYAKTASYTITTSDIGKTFTNEGAGTNIQFTLPIVTSLPSGFWVRGIILAAQQVDFDPNVVDQIYPTTDAAGDRLRNSGVIGSNVTLEYTHADGWSIVNETGTWTDAN